jgi:hypothetical protein
MKSFLLLSIVTCEEEEKIIDRYFIDTGLREAVMEKETD